MENNKHAIKELNAFLEGNYIAIQAYERYIQHVGDSNVKPILQQIQQDHKQHAIRISERIQNLGGVPVDDAGMKGMMAETMMRLKGATDDPNFILKDALKGEHKGIGMSEKIITGDLDLESRHLVEEVLNDDRNHVEQLNKYLH